MRAALLVLTLALIWAAITGSFNPLNLLLGAGLGLVVALLLRQSLQGRINLRRLRAALSLLGLFLWELMVSAVRVSIIVLSPNLKAALNPAIIAFPLTVKSDAEITLLANLITLTPGTLSIDVSEDRSTLYVHVLALTTREDAIADIANGFEAKVRELYA
ncbi:cation:proton antiporter [Devosia epidermidihirudinis]|uniref:Cation:proton antiporter n=1 Tax=Devosia epidermidihirudinis TaxID=1293439 RepID=A0A0F5QGJ9_9HYPH|nr:Na+/H+ antiporter subunit E [Devosia epidermidihirudinis]KKC39838.1 cation:proton antiporter [Devosia epidermidihirudinis]